MPFTQTTENMPASAPPEQTQVVKWLWMIDQCSSPIVKIYGEKMIATHFESREAAEQFTAKSQQ
ncbi:hypothetical protein HQQ94_00240 [Shewanella sp. VB17]|uniref:hypothetical protein n=1 Tax=Shewanella sp. VB17 TaxID=2739432 RepID=UPI0015664819|nr:hypothetical protein [Shewanella sp. VB17]NRD71703.1 hypothetical protein [Shewanella sp. VB17]